MNREELLNALQIVKPGLANKEIIEQATSFAFANNRVVTYNDEISISHSVKGLNITGAVKAEGLYQLLSKLTQSEIEITATDNELLLRSGRIKAGIPLQQEIKIPLIDRPNKWLKLPDDFKEAIKFTMASCSKDMSSPILTCIHVKNEQVESLDGYRVTCYKIAAMPTDSFLLPANIAADLIGYDLKYIATSDNWMHFKAGKTIISCRVLEGQFPDIKPFLKVRGPVIKLPRSLSEVLNKATIFSKKQDLSIDEEVKITLKKNRMTIRGQGNAGWFEEELNLVYSGDEIIFWVNPESLELISKQAQTCILGTNRLKFAGGPWQHTMATATEESEESK